MATKFQEEVDKLLECVICLEEIKQPKMLQCPHSFCFDPCLKNLAKWAQKSSLKYALECPVCRKTSYVDQLDHLQLQLINPVVALPQLEHQQL